MNSPTFLQRNPFGAHAALAAALEQLLHSTRTWPWRPSGNGVGRYADRLDHADSALFENPPGRLPHGAGEHGLAIVQQLRQFRASGWRRRRLQGHRAFDQRGRTAGLWLEYPKQEASPMCWLMSTPSWLASAT